MKVGADSPQDTVNKINLILRRWYAESVQEPSNPRIDKLGHILHLVQDSYSKGHTERVDDCEAIIRFKDYTNPQDTAGHAKYDSWKYAFPDNKLEDAPKEVKKAIEASTDVQRHGTHCDGDCSRTFILYR